MPYYIYTLGPIGVLNKIGEDENFRAARAIANERRKTLGPNDGLTVKVIFAANELAAEVLLSTPSSVEHPYAGDDY
ncbi:MAG: hypothetical protein D4R70_06920 [Betaproteobacteria bacterium]|nr:MAG: hypothetical protein D4R70_06920 [Betaproteobacteria bacterium]